MRLSLISVAAVSLTLAACNQPEATPPADTPAAPVETAPAATDAAASDWSALNAQVGKYPNDTGLLENSPITADLKALLGNKYDVFAINMQTQSPLEKEGAILFTSGNKPHEGASSAAYLLIDTAAKGLEVGLWEGGKLTTYKTPGSNIAKPADIQALISNFAG
ncbi:hypothetical protein [Brevundimonas diminuta]|uniref:hypothetical protein n=1 Tax=Brevundimonas diminuta TaxID=293 RepID=UPI003D058403